MSAITIEELKKLDLNTATIVDIRPVEDYERGTFPGAISIPMAELPKRMAEIPKEKPVYIMCHTGGQWEGSVSCLKEAGYEVSHVEGGYRLYLRMELDAFVQDTNAVREKTKEIERSIIKKYRKTIWRGFTKAIQKYELIQEGDKIAVCISGGKDSMILAKLMQEIQRHGKFHFELVFLIMNPGYSEDNWKIILNNAKILGIPLTVFESDIFNVVAEIDQNPCYLCARMRRGYLYSHAKTLGCNKIALGHHFDDMIETILMGMLYSGKIETMMPKLHSKNFPGMELIRPMYMVREADIKAWRDYHGLHFIQCACRFTESVATCGSGQESKRDEMKKLISHFREISDVIDMNIFNSVHNINLRTVIGYHKDDMQYNFLDDYEKYRQEEADERDCQEISE